MKQVIAAGAGHGALTAAVYLAKAGYDVTVYEKNRREDMGHDWEDRFTFSLLEEITGRALSETPDDTWRFRGDCAFVSPAKRKKVVVHYEQDKRQKIMKRKALVSMLLNAAEEAGAKLVFGTEVLGPITEGDKVTGIKTDKGDFTADFVIDGCGVFSPVRKGLPDSFGIEKEPKRGDLFYAKRAYFERDLSAPLPAVPFEVYMYHEGEQGLSWICTNADSVDILIGRIDPFGEEKWDEKVDTFRKEHPWFGSKIVSGGQYGIIPVRRPLTLMIANGYAATGDAAFTTLPMNGMGIDLSLNAGRLLAETVIKSGGDFSKEALWIYNRDFHALYGGTAAKNEGLKNAILSLPSEGVDFLFESGVIAASDLAGAGTNMTFGVLMGKLVNGMKNPPYFFKLIKGLINGAGASKLYKNAPVNYDIQKIKEWSEKISAKDIRIL